MKEIDISKKVSRVPALERLKKQGLEFKGNYTMFNEEYKLKLILPYYDLKGATILAHEVVLGSIVAIAQKHHVLKEIVKSHPTAQEMEGKFLSIVNSKDDLDFGSIIGGLAPQFMGGGTKLDFEFDFYEEDGDEAIKDQDDIQPINIQISAISQDTLKSTLMNPKIIGKLIGGGGGKKTAPGSGETFNIG